MSKLKDGTMLSVKKTLENAGFEDIDKAVHHALSNSEAPAMCAYGCYVEPDGVCQHGNPSVLRHEGKI